MKNKLLAVSLIILSAAILVKTGMVLAVQPPITEVCKTNGGILMAKDSCPAGADKFPLGTIPVSGAGNIAFVEKEPSFDRYYFLLNNRQVLWFDPSYKEELQILDKEQYSIPEEIEIKDIAQWRVSIIVLKNGDVWMNEGDGSGNYFSSGWIKMELPL